MSILFNIIQIIDHMIRTINNLFCPTIIRATQLYPPLALHPLYIHDQKLKQMYPNDDKKSYIGYRHSNVLARALRDTIKLQYDDADVDVHEMDADDLRHNLKTKLA